MWDKWHEGHATASKTTAVPAREMVSSSSLFQRVSMRISTRLRLGTALALIAMAGMAISSHGTMALIALAQTAKEPQTKATAEFLKLDAATLPIIKKIQIGGDADWLGLALARYG